MAVFLLFLLALATGVLTTVFWVPGEDLGRGYFQLKALIVVGLLALALAVVVLHPIEPFGARSALGTAVLGAALALTVVSHGAIWRQRWGSARVAAALALLASLSTLLLSGSVLAEAGTPLPHRTPLLVVALLSGTLLLGWSLVTMLLGHWYLVVPKLTFRHLIVFCRILLGLVVVRWIAVMATVLAAKTVDPFSEPNPWRLLIAFDGQGMFFWFRVAWGLAIPLVLAVMSLHCARNRSNQSATGILYVLVMGTLIGEITALYLTVTTGVPV